MGLPEFKRPEGTVEFEGHTLTVYGISRGEAQELAEFDWDKDNKEVEIRLIAYGLKSPLNDEFRTWYDDLPMQLVKPLVEKVMELSGLRDDSPKE